MNHEPEAELRRIVRMLEKTAQMAEHASLTGSLAGGKEYAVRSYNAVLKHLAETGEVPAALFPSLPDTASIDEVGMASAQLAEYLRAGFPEPEAGAAGNDSAMKLGDGNVFFNIGSLGEIAELVRENLPEWLRGKRVEKEPESGRTERPETSEAAASPPPAAARGNGEPPPTAQRSLPSQQVRIEELRPGQRQEEAPR